MLVALWNVTSWHWKATKMFLIPSGSLWLCIPLYLSTKTSIVKTHMILQLLIVRPSIYFVINIFMWSCSSNVIPQCRWCWWAFFEDPRFSSSPSPPQRLPIYAENMVSFLVVQPSPSMHRNTKHYDWRVLDFRDLEADSCLTSITTSSNDG